MGLFKEVKKPVIRSVASGGGEISPLRPRFAPKAPPCASACPNGSEIRELMVTIAQAKDYGLTREQAFERVWNRIVERNPFPAVTGRICPHPCETACNRSAKDGPVAFNAIERMIGDFGIANKLKLSRLAVQPHAAQMHQDGVTGFGAFNEKGAGERIAGFGMAHRPGGLVLRLSTGSARIPGHGFRSLERTGRHAALWHPRIPLAT